MMRPRYETEGDRIAEAEVAGQLHKHWDCTLHKTPPKYPYDFVAERGGKLRGLIEIKRRSTAATLYPTYMISADKIIKCGNASEVLGVSFYLVVQFSDLLLWWEYNRGDFDLALGGRRDRNDAQDIEPVVHIDIHKFNEVDGYDAWVL